MSLTETIYTRIDGFINDLPIYFLNHGYSPAYSEFEGVQFKHQLSLYKKSIDGISLDNKSILEVGCGRGGGSKWISDTYNVMGENMVNLIPEHLRATGQITDSEFQDLKKKEPLVDRVNHYHQ